MQVTQDDDPESRGRLAPHELPLVMAAFVATHHRVRRHKLALANVQAAGGDDRRVDLGL